MHIRQLANAQARAQKMANSDAVLPRILPKGKRFQELMHRIDQCGAMNVCLQPLMSRRQPKIFSIVRLCAAHLRRRLVRLRVRRLIEFALEHVAILQKARRSARIAMSLDFKSLLARGKRMIESIVRISPDDKPIFAGFCPERVLLGIAATIRA